MNASKCNWPRQSGPLPDVTQPQIQDPGFKDSPHDDILMTKSVFPNGDQIHVLLFYPHLKMKLLSHQDRHISTSNCVEISTNEMMVQLMITFRLTSCRYSMIDRLDPVYWYKGLYNVLSVIESTFEKMQVSLSSHWKYSVSNDGNSVIFSEIRNFQNILVMKIPIESRHADNHSSFNSTELREIVLVELVRMAIAVTVLVAVVATTTMVTTTTIMTTT